MPKLTLDDIADLRAYERERDEFRREVIELKGRRRIPLGDFLTLVFENERTIRFQIQEMARAEKLLSDAAIETELRTYNPLIPSPGQLCATLFVELTSKLALMEWLPRLVGIERSVALRLPDGSLVPAVVDEDHERQLTREEITASVHYVRWDLRPDQVERFAEGPVGLVVDHPNLELATELRPESAAELLDDLRNGG
jgi:transcriptional antiterminator Rof (Rho-off)